MEGDRPPPTLEGRSVHVCVPRIAWLEYRPQTPGFVPGTRKSDPSTS
jgi:hypothetical protein